MGTDDLNIAVLHHDMDSNERDSDGLTPLIHAVISGHEEVVRLLLSYGARLGERDWHCRSVLHWAVIARRETMLVLLLNHASNNPLLIDAYDDTGCTPLHEAIKSSFEQGVTVLLRFGANLHSRAKKC